jgi:hypothetical protein
MNFWTIERIKELLGPGKLPATRVEDDGHDAWLDGYQSRYSVVYGQGFVYAWVPNERMAQLYAAAPEALAWCIDTIATAQALANSYAATNEAQRQRMSELQEHVNTAVQCAKAAEEKLALVDRYAIYVADQIAAVSDGTASYSIFSKWLEQQPQPRR